MSKNNKWEKINAEDLALGDTVKYVAKFPGSKIIRKGVITDRLPNNVFQIKKAGSEMYIDDKSSSSAKVTLYKKRIDLPSGLGAILDWKDEGETFKYVLVFVGPEGQRIWYSVEVGLVDDSDLELESGTWTVVSKGVKL